MKKIIYSKLTVLILLAGITSLTSCLKDKRFEDFGASKPIIELPLGGLSNFTSDAITDSKDTIVKQFAVNLASPTELGQDLVVTVGVDNSIIDKYKATNSSVDYLPLPTDSYKFADAKVTIPKGTRTQILSVTFYKSKLDPSKSYMLPITIKDGGGQIISGIYNTRYFHFIGNDFAGAYKHQFTRVPATATSNYTYADGKSSTFFPDSPTQFEVAGGYYTQDIRYVVNFTKTGTGSGATYSHFSIAINQDDVDRIAANKIAITAQPIIIGYTEKEYTFAEASVLFDNGFQYSVLGSSGSRVNHDQYKK
ncbi:DUF1735 domain-containing protein [Mucilaginibacter sp. RB4R14]|uniref:DUF1735 domain-containing protein n=1 Tax=Mucilaginibacter aurantiaciroseus TaxID=2949308 RepID=UPI00209004DE|nr:DUF1735 domain-containing protein [Mucilaginibacter aurantiaciroseus]MCO5936681.1 DUF1735 domain-containing protein [Mucilaginibacter aurantiaciroseus]